MLGMLFGTLIGLLHRGQPVLGERGECLGAVVNLVDITAMKVLDRLKSEFVAKVSHELRSPLSTIHEQLALVLNDLMGQLSESEEHLLSRAKEKTQGLISTIGDLLDLSRIESGNTCQEPKPVQLEDLLSNIVDFLGTRARTKRQTLSLERPSNPLPTIKAKKFYEVQKYINLTGHISDSLLTIIGGPLWNKLSAADRDIFTGVMKDAALKASQDIVDSENSLASWFEAQGVTVNKVDITPFREATMKLHNGPDATWSQDVYDRLQAIK